VNGKRAVVDESKLGIEDAGVPTTAAEKHSFFGVFQKRNKEFVSPILPDPSPAEMAPFAEDLLPSALYALVDPKSYDHLQSLGGTQGLLTGLKTSKEGLEEVGGEGSVNEADNRRRVYGENRVPVKKSKSFLALCWAAYTVRPFSPRFPSK
jgi:hypothetical protein